MPPFPKAEIIIVDDQPANVKFLENVLKEDNYAVRSFTDGRQALAAAADDRPDLFLLDITMPEMDGFQVCERLKADERLRSVPVIFLSALTEPQDKLRAFQVGGVDYVVKPFQLEEVRARVQTHLELHRLQRELKQHNEHLEELVQLRTRELAEAHQRLRILDQSKNDFLNLISHELRTPLNGLLGIGEILLEESSSISDGVQLREMFGASRERIMSILDHALLLTQIEVEGEKFAQGPARLDVVLELAAHRAAEFAQARKVNLEVMPAPPALVVGDSDLLKKAFAALLETSIKLSGAGETVKLACEIQSDFSRATIETKGRSIPPQSIGKFFDVFSIGEAVTPGGDLGLGPPLAYRILALFGGSVSIENRAPQGTKMTVCLKPAGR